MRFGGTSDGDFVRRALIVVAITGITLLLWYLVDVLLLFFGAILFAVLLRGASVPISRRTGMGDSWALLATTLAVTLFITLAVVLFGNEVRTQLVKLAETLPSAWDLFMRRTFSGHLRDAVLNQAEDAVPAAGDMLSSVLLGAWSLVGGLGAVILMIAGGLYLAAQPDLYRKGFLYLLPDDGKRAQAAETLDAVGEALRLWLQGQLLIMAFIFVATLAGLWLIGVPAALALAVFAGLAQFVPILGPIVAAVPALLVALNEDWQMVLWVLGLYVVLQQVESNLVTPLVQRRTVHLPPVLPLFAVVVFALLFGFMGVLFATPLAVVAYVAIKKLWVRDTLGEATHLPGEPKPEPEPEPEASAAANDAPVANHDGGGGPAAAPGVAVAARAPD